MITAEDFKYWLRSRSFSFMSNRRSQRQEIAVLSWQGEKIFYRPGTSDTTLIYRILLKPSTKREYQLPPHLSPKIILDIGANIGITSLFLSHSYPQAKIYSFEPEANNFELLKKNVSGRSQVFPFQMALGAQNGTLQLFASDDAANFGGFSFFDHGINPERSLSVPVRNAAEMLAELGLSEIDLIKIDTEGAEFDILTTIPPQLLQKVDLILGELHGHRDFDLLAYLSPWFDLAVRKDLESRLGTFTARRRAQ